MAVSLVHLFAACLGILLLPVAAESPGVLLASALGHPAHRAPPDHAALTERFHFLEVLHPSKPGVQPDGVEESWHVRQLRAAEQRLHPWNLNVSAQWGLPSILASTQTLPYPLRRRFTDEDFLGQGSFGAAFKAVDKTTNQIVVVKMLVYGGVFLTPSLAHIHPEAKKWVQESIDECSKIREIRENIKAYPEGSPHVLMCLEDGIQATMDDPDKTTDPLYIVLNFAGDEYGKWWNSVRKSRTKVEAASALRALTRDLMKGLRALTHEDAKTKWIHHDLKPGNIAVSGEWDNSTLSLIDMGGAVPDSKPDLQEVCTPIFRPLDLAYPTRTRVGWKKPVHSFDMASAGLTILSSALASSPNALGLGPGAWPLWVSDTTARILNEFISLKNLKDVADCVGKQSNEEASAFVNRYNECFEKEGVNKQLGPALHKMVGQIGVGNSDSSRMLAFSPVASCGGGSEPSWAPDMPETAGYIVHEWVTTDFDKVLGRMLDLDPTKRPSPEEVLAEKWLATDYQPKPTGDTTYNIQLTSCKEELVKHVAQHFLWAIYMPLGVAAATGCCACGCCCFGSCCHLLAETPSAGFTAVIIGFAAVGTAFGSGVWFAQFTQIVLIISSFVLGPAMIVLGFNSLRRPGVEDSAKTGWTIGLFAAGAYFLMLWVAIFWLSRSTKHVLFYISDHWNAIKEAGDAEELQSITFLDQPMYAALANLISATLAPAGVGLVAVGFGLFREHEHRRMNRQAPARRVTGTEMSSRQSAVAGP